MTLPSNYPIPAEVFNYALATERSLGAACVDNERLRQQIERQTLREKAFSCVEEGDDGCTYTNGPSGQRLKLLNHKIEAVYKLYPQAPLFGSVLYLIFLKGTESPIVLTEAEYLSSRKLIARLNEAPGVCVTIQNSESKTVGLLRSLCSTYLTCASVDLYAGWSFNRDGVPSFRTFANFSTHQQLRGRFQYGTSPLPEFSPAVAASAIKQFWRNFALIKDPFCQYVLALFWHTAAVYSLLDLQTSNFPSALCCFSTDPEMTLFLKTLFSWYGDTALSFELGPIDFSAGMLERKDESLVIDDIGDLSKNAKTLLGAITTRLVPWKVGKDDRTFPLKAPILILSDRASVLTCNPAVAVLDLPPDCLDSEMWVERFRYVQANQDYIKAFNSFVQANYSKFQDLLVSAYQEALRRSQGKLNETSTRSFGTFMAVSVFLTEFFSACSLFYDDLSVDLLNEDLLQQLFEFFEQMSAKSDAADLSEQFVAIVRDSIKHKTLRLLPKTSPYDPSLANAAYAGADTIFFPVDTFYKICRSMAQSRPQILQALDSANLMCGAPINRNTRQSRITMKDPEGRPVQLHGYAVRRSAIDFPGDALPIGGVDF